MGLSFAPFALQRALAATTFARPVPMPMHIIAITAMSGALYSRYAAILRSISALSPSMPICAAVFSTASPNAAMYCK